MAILLFFLFLLASATNSVPATTDLTAFVYKTCNQTLQNQTTNLTLDALFTTLVSESNTTNFFQTTITNITGLYQCRGDLSHTKCNTCVQTLTNTIQTECYTARAQSVGCYMWYEVDAYHVDYLPKNGLWHEECGVRAGSGTDFDVNKNRAMKVLVDSVGNKKGYFATRFWYSLHDSGYVLGQCEGDLGDDDCVDCVKTAVNFAQVDCDTSFSGDVYLQKCYISYSDGGDDNCGNAGGLVAFIVAIVVFMLRVIAACLLDKVLL
ncbi:cysteine-rich repeat secretory protein 11-like protein isoform X1 [Tanacetum coccineum]